MIDYLDPYRTTRLPAPPVEHPLPPGEVANPDPTKEEALEEPARDEGETVDEYA